MTPFGRDRCRTTPSVTPNPRAFTSGTTDLACAWLRRAVDQDAVPVDLQVCGDANLFCSLWELSCEVGRHGARAARRESHIINYSLPVSVGGLGFDVGSNRLEFRLGCRVHAVGGEVFDFAVSQNPQWATVVWLTQIERESMRLGESGKLR